jgi:hypothetical protein
VDSSWSHSRVHPAVFPFLSCVPRKRLEKLYKEIFYFNFKNLFYATGRHNTFLCYQVKRTQHGLTNPLDRGVFTKQVRARLFPSQAGAKPGENAEKITSKMPDSRPGIW